MVCLFRHGQGQNEDLDLPTAQRKKMAAGGRAVRTVFATSAVDAGQPIWRTFLETMQPSVKAASAGAQDGILRSFLTEAIRIQLVCSCTTQGAEPNSSTVQKKRFGAGSRRLRPHGNLDHVTAGIPEVAERGNGSRWGRRHRFGSRSRGSLVRQDRLLCR